MTPVADPSLAEALAGLRAGIDRVAKVGVEPSGRDDALAVARQVEHLARRVGSLQQAVLAEIDRGGFHKVDGHATAAVFVRHAANLSAAEAKRRAKAGRMLRDLPHVAAAFAAGTIGQPQVDRIARVHANTRVRAALMEADAHVALLAARLPYKELDDRLADWERLTDEDGTRDRAERSHETRDFLIHPNFDGSYRFLGGCGDLQGAEMRTILQAYVAAEFAADWTEARAEHGDATTVDHLARTDAQRRADAHYAIYRDAATALAARPGGTTVVTNLVMDQETFERHLRRFAGETVGPDERLATFFTDLLADLDDAGAGESTLGDRAASDHAPSAPPDAAGGDPGATTRAKRQPFRSGTLDGQPIEPTALASTALLGHIRRGVVRPDGVTLDLGRRSRLFTGPTQLAVKLSRTTCYWPGCHVPVSQCQADHLTAYGGPKQGRTNPDNGAPLCGKHNRHKEHGFTVHRDERGRVHIHRPDGTEIPALP